MSEELGEKAVLVTRFDCERRKCKRHCERRVVTERA
jgi:hypothetical protein